MTRSFAAFFAPVLMLLLGIATAVPAATSRAKVEQFLTTTGFDVALDSIRQSAGTAPAMLGVEADAFGQQWTSMADRVFDTGQMRDIAIEILQNTLSDAMLDHGVAFYATEFGKRIVAAENASHLIEDDGVKSEAGEAIVAGLVRHGSERLSDLKRLNAAAGNAEASVKALQEIQLRFLMAAAAADVIELRLDEDGMRAMLSRQSGALLQSLETSALSGAAYTYQALSDDEVSAYADALEHPLMRELYELMNAVQYEVMANRFEALAAAMSALQPSTDL